MANFNEDNAQYLVNKIIALLNKKIEMPIVNDETDNEKSLVYNSTTKKFELKLIENNIGVDGKDGREIELQKSDTHIQWKYVDEVNWKDLVLLSELKGEDGINGQDGAKGDKGDAFTYEDFTPEQLASLKGEQGLPGKDGINGIDGLTTSISLNGATYTHVNGNINLPNYPTVFTKTSELINDSSFATETFVKDKIIEAQLGTEIDLSGYATKNDLNNKVDKVEGKGLSTNDFTNNLKSNYDTAYTHSQSIHAPSDAEQNVQSDWNITDVDSDAYIKNKPTIPSIEGLATETFVNDKLDGKSLRYLTQAEYDALTDEQKGDTTIVWNIIDAETISQSNIELVDYDSATLPTLTPDVYQTKVDNNLNTSDKNLVNAINEINAKTNELFQNVSNGKSLIASAITDKGISTLANDSFIQMANNINNINTLPNEWVNEQTYEAKENIVKGDAVSYKNRKEYTDEFTKIPNSSDLSDKPVISVTFSHDDKYLVFGRSGSPYVIIYEVDKETNTFTELANPSVLPEYNVKTIVFSHDDKYLVVGGDDAPYIHIYEVDKETNTFTELADSNIMPSTVVYSIVFSNDDKYMVVGSGGTDRLCIYEVDKETNTFTKLTNPSTYPSSSIMSIAFSHDDKYMTLGSSEAPYITIYKVDKVNNAFTKLSDPSTLPTNGIVRSVSFSNDGKYLVVGGEFSSFFYIYEVNKETNTFTKLGNPSIMPKYISLSVSFSNEDEYLAVAHKYSPYVTIYKVDKETNTFTKLANPSVLPKGDPHSMAFSNDEKYLVIGHEGESYLTIYDTGFINQIGIYNYVPKEHIGIPGYALESKNQGEMIRVNLFDKFN